MKLSGPLIRGGPHSGDRQDRYHLIGNVHGSNTAYYIFHAYEQGASLPLIYHPYACKLLR